MNFYSERKIEKNKTSITYFINDIYSIIDMKNKLREDKCVHIQPSRAHTLSPSTLTPGGTLSSVFVLEVLC